MKALAVPEMKLFRSRPARSKVVEDDERSGYSVPSRDVNSKTTKCKEKRRDPDVIPAPAHARLCDTPSGARGDGWWRGDCFATRPAASLRDSGFNPPQMAPLEVYPTFQLVLILALVKE